MAKNNNNQNSAVADVETSTEEVKVQEVKQPKQANKQKNTKVGSKKKSEKKPSKIVKKFKEIASELKKVTWPNFSSVVKKTCIVLTVVLIFAVVLFGIDRLLAWLFDLLTTSVA